MNYGPSYIPLARVQRIGVQRVGLIQHSGWQHVEIDGERIGPLYPDAMVSGVDLAGSHLSDAELCMMSEWFSIVTQYTAELCQSQRR
jgi:hypothetical protein